MGLYHPSQWASWSNRRRSPRRTVPNAPLGSDLRLEILETRTLPSQGIAGQVTSASSPTLEPAATTPSETGTAELSGIVFLDLNDNGVFEAGEPGIGGVLITLFGVERNGHFLQVSQTTDASGRYHFLGLNPGVYALEQTQPAGFVDSWDRVGSLGGITRHDRFEQIVVEEGQTGEGYDFAERPSGSTTYRLYVAGYIYIDINNNGVRDAGNEPGIPGQKVILRSEHGYSATVTTDEFGKYIFVDIPAGTYSVTEIQPAGYFDGIDTPGTPYGGSAGPIGTDRFTGLVLPVETLVIGDDYNFGELVPGEISGFVFVDANNNGRFDATEEGIAGVLVTLRGVNDLGENVVRSVRTSANGQFRFTGLRPGTYSLEDQRPEGFTDGKISVGSKGGRLQENRIVDIPVDGWTKAERYLFGKRPLPRTSRIEGYVYNDRNNNGQMDPGEAGIEGVEIILVGNNRRLTTTTGPDGSFLFVVDRPGTYTLIENLDERTRGLIDGKDTFGTGFQGTVEDDRMTLLVEANKTGRNFLFGELILADMVASEANSGNRFQDRTQGAIGTSLAGAVGMRMEGRLGDQWSPINVGLDQRVQRATAAGPNSVTGFSNQTANTSSEWSTDPAAVIADAGLALRVNELFGGEVPFLDEEADERLSESLAATQLTGGRLQTQAGLRRGASLGSLAVLTQSEGGEDSDHVVRSDHDLPLMQCLLGLEAPYIRERKVPGESNAVTENELPATDAATTVETPKDTERSTSRVVVAGGLTAGALLVAGKLAYDRWQTRRTEAGRKKTT
jgi:protocatechuate 3,4-dioxygenase beta subunit